MRQTQQLNIEGKRSGDGFVCHRERLIEAIAKAQSDIIEVVNTSLGRKGLLAYLKALDGSNTVKVVPDGEQGLKVVCGANVSYVPKEAWVGKKPNWFSACQVIVSPHSNITPNLGANELADALAKVLPFTEQGKEARANLKCIYFKQSNGCLVLTGVDGYKLCSVSLAFSDGEEEALIPANELKGLTQALKRAKRVRIGFQEDDKGKALVIHTESISYKFNSERVSFPDYDKVIPTKYVATATIDTKAMLKAVKSLKALSLDKLIPITLTFGNDKVGLEGNQGKVELEAQTEGEGKLVMPSDNLAKCLRAIGAGIAEVKMSSPTAPLTISLDGVLVLCMPIHKPETTPAKPTETETEAQAEAVAEGEAVAQAEVKPRGKRKAKEPVPVA